jgi:L-fuculose-phosphate aldolase
LVAGPDGNVSVRLPDESILVTPSGLSKVDVTLDDLVIVHLDGSVLDGRRSPSSELAMHLRIYRRRDDVRAVAGESFMAPVLPEVILQMGAVPLVPYATPGTEDLPDAMEPFLAAHDAFLLANHGATTVGQTLVAAHQRMESLEHAARILLAARTVGRVNELTTADANRLRGAGKGVRIADE